MPQGWRQTGTNAWIRKHSEDRLDVSKPSKSDFWFVTFRKSSLETFKWDKSFKDKSKAIDFAMKYMKEHPRG